MKVRDLKRVLDSVSDDLPVGRLGHYGEFHSMNEDDFSVSKALDTKKDVFDISAPDIGPEPD